MSIANDLDACVGASKQKQTHSKDKLKDTYIKPVKHVFKFDFKRSFFKNLFKNFMCNSILELGETF